jgi:hypothetical protein
LKTNIELPAKACGFLIRSENSLICGGSSELANAGSRREVSFFEPRMMLGVGQKDYKKII